MSAPAYVVRWPHQGDKPAPGYLGNGADGLTQWLECVADGRVVFLGGVHAGHEPEDMCLGRDLDEFVDELNAVAAERDALRAQVEAAIETAEAIRADEDTPSGWGREVAWRILRAMDGAKP